MVHSDSTSPMKTTLSVSPHLTVTATAPPLVPPPLDTTGQDLTQTTAKLHTSDITSNLDLSQPSTQTLADAEPPVLTPVKALTANSTPASGWSSPHTTTPAQGTANGRTSGRRRTPKACDCCGPNSTGHNVRTPGRGRGRGRARGSGRDLSDTPKRKIGGQLTRIKSFDLTKEKVEEEEDEDDRYDKVQMSVVVADAQPQTPVALPVNVPLLDGPIRNCVAPEKGDVQKKEDMLTEESGVAGTGVKGRGSAVRGRGGRGKIGATYTYASKMKAEVGMKRGVEGGVIGSKTDALTRPVLVQGHEENKDAEMEHEEQADSISVKYPFGNGDTINLSETEPEGDDSINVTKPENGILSISGQSGSASSPGSQDLDSEMQVDQTPDRTDPASLPVTLSNGNAATPTDHDHTPTPTVMETVSSPNQGPISLCSVQHRWALRDHRLYCQPGTWEKQEAEGTDQSKETQDMDGKTLNNESLEQLTDMVHEFLESFYIKYGSFIPLSETDVVEYLKKKGTCDLSNKGLNIKGEMTRYRAGLASAPISGFMVMYNKHTLSLEDLSTLEDQNWLNDQIINMYGELIMEATQHKVHFFNSFFHKQLVAKGYEGVKRWTKKVDLFSKWLLLIPIHLEIHWSLVTVTMATKTINYYDSQGIVFRHTTDNIMKYLQSEAREKKQTAFQKGWKITIIKGIPQQKNDSDCGVFVLEYCRRLSVKQPLQFSQEDMPRIRKRLYKELCDCRLND